MSDSIVIREVHNYSEFMACEDIQRQAWKMTGDRDVVPAHLLAPVVENGGAVIGAFDAQGRMVGVVFGFVGRLSDERAAGLESPYIFCSEMMGVLPEARGLDVGSRLKLAQRDMALTRGYQLITWTYDPLLSLNARLNITKLGCICRRYVRDAYGEMGGIYAGISTDRFSVEWWIASAHVQAVLAGSQRAPSAAGLPVANSPQVGPDGLPRPGRFDLPDAETFTVHAPADFNALKAADMEVAKAWRAHTRDLFEAAFAQGCVVIGFEGRPESSVSAYILTRHFDTARLA